VKQLSLNESEIEPNYRSPLHEDSGPCPLCFLWTAGTFRQVKKKKSIEQASNQNFLPKSSSWQPGQREAGIAVETCSCYRDCLAFKI